MDNIELEGGMPMVPPMAPEDKGNPVTMNVSMNASGKDHVADLIDMMKNAGMDGAKELTPDMMPPRQDMERLRDIVDGPKDMDDLKPGMQDEPCDDCGKQHVGASSCMDDIDADIDEGAVKAGMIDDCENMSKEDFCEKYMAMGMDKKECEDQWSSVNEAGYANEPEEEYKSVDDVIFSGDDLHKSKRAYSATQDGDNPMAVEDEDEATYTIKGKSPEAQEELARRANEEDALEDSIREELYKAIQAKMAEGRGRGKKKKEGADHEHGADMEKCPECGKKKQKLMACGSCGCS